MAIIEVNEQNFAEEILQAQTPVIVDFWAPWCGPCRMIGPALEEISQELNGQVKITKINIDDNPNLAMRYGVRSIPTLLLFDKGEQKAQRMGAVPKSQLCEWIKKESGL